jgi:hypothetical protein
MNFFHSARRTKGRLCCTHRHLTLEGNLFFPPYKFMVEIRAKVFIFARKVKDKQSGDFRRRSVLRRELAFRPYKVYYKEL